MFKKKSIRARLWAREQRMKEDGIEIPEGGLTEEDLPTEAELKAEGQKIELEKGDLKAMIIAAFTTIFPACVVVLLLFALFAFLLISVF